MLFDMALCLQACASFCLLSQSCLSFQYSIERVDCVWFPSAQFDVISNNTGYWFYTKSSAEVTSNCNDFYMLSSLMFIIFGALPLLYEVLWEIFPVLSQCFYTVSLATRMASSGFQPLNICRSYSQSFSFWGNCLQCFELPSVLWHCWLGVRESIRPVKIEWWGANDLHMVQLMSLPPHCLLLHWNPHWFNLSVAGLPRLSWKRGH